MKKILIVAMMAIVCLNANAQNMRHDAGTFTLQPMVGLTGGTFSGNYSGLKIEGDDPRVGLIAGAEAEYYTGTPWLSFSAGLMYAQQGWKFTNSWTAKLDYLNIPIMANFYVAKGFALKIGLQPGFLMSAKEDSDDVKSDCETFNFSVPFGLSYEFGNGINLDLRWAIGMTAINKNSRDDLKMRNDCLYLTVGYKFGL